MILSIIFLVLDKAAEINTEHGRKRSTNNTSSSFIFYSPEVHFRGMAAAKDAKNPMSEIIVVHISSINCSDRVFNGKLLVCNGLLVGGATRRADRYVSPTRDVYPQKLELRDCSDPERKASG